MQKKWINLIVTTSLIVIFVAFICLTSVAQYLSANGKMPVNLSAYGGKVNQTAYRNAMAETELIYYKNKRSFPKDEKSLRQVQRYIVKSIAEEDILYHKAKTDGNVSIDKKETRKKAESFYSNIKTNNIKYNYILKKYKTSDKALHQYIINRYIKEIYVKKTVERFDENLKKDRMAYLNQSAGSINGRKVTRGEYLYYLVMRNLSSISNGDGAISVSSKTNKAIFKEIGKNRKMLVYCQKNNIEISGKEKEQKAMNQALRGFFESDKEFNHFLEDYGMNAQIFRRYQEEQARAEAAEAAVQNDMAHHVNVSDQEVKAYYNKHKASYEKDTVSACHILVKKKTLAYKIARQAQDIHTKKAFKALMNKYQHQNGVIEAADLGTFGTKTMVSAFTNAAFSAPLNQTVGPVKTRYGYHIIFVYAKTSANQGKEAWKKHRTSIKKKVSSQKAKAKMKDLTSQSDEIKIVRYLNFPKTMFVKETIAQTNLKVFN